MSKDEWRLLIVLTAFTVLGCASATRAPADSTGRPNSSLVARSGRLFAFHSDVLINLHHFLYNVARARKRLSAASQLDRDTSRVSSLSESQRELWNVAVDYYITAGLADRDAVFDSLLNDIQSRLVAAGDAGSLRASGLPPDLIAALVNALPVYRALWWPQHDVANRAWVASMLPLLARVGDTLAASMASAYETSWPTTPIRVDVAPYANWAGAYGTSPPPHVTISSLDDGYKEWRGLEMLFHEASHTIADSLAPVLRQLAAERGKAAPFGVLHPIIFFTAGDATRRLVPGYAPYAEAGGMWNGRMGIYLPAIQRYWIPHLEGRSTLREALRGIVDNQPLSKPF